MDEGGGGVLGVRVKTHLHEQRGRSVLAPVHAVARSFDSRDQMVQLFPPLQGPQACNQMIPSLSALGMSMKSCWRAGIVLCGLVSHQE